MERIGYTDLQIGKLKPLEIDIYALISGKRVVRTADIKGKERFIIARVMEKNPWQTTDGQKVFEIERVRRGEWEIKPLIPLRPGIINFEEFKQLRKKISKVLYLYLWAEITKPGKEHFISIERLANLLGLCNLRHIPNYINRAKKEINEKTILTVDFHKLGEVYYYRVGFKNPQIVPQIGQERRKIYYEEILSPVEGLKEKIANRIVPPDIQVRLSTYFGTPEFTYWIALWTLSEGEKELYWHEVFANTSKVESLNFFKNLFPAEFDLISKKQQEFMSFAYAVFGVFFPYGVKNIISTLRKAVEYFIQTGIWSNEENSKFKRMLNYTFLDSLKLPLLTVSELAYLFRLIRGKCIVKDITCDSLGDLLRQISKGGNKNVESKTT
jgi:hypothetical protein